MDNGSLGGPPLVTPEPEPFRVRVYTPEESRERQGARPMPRRHPDTAPLAPPGSVAVVPTEAGVRAYIHQTTRTIAPRVELMEIALDFDPELEILARVPFEMGPGQRSYQWLVLLDKRGEGYIALESWTDKGVDVQADVVAHGRGDRAVLVVESQGPEVSLVEVVRLSTSGKLSRTARLGGRIGHRGLVRAQYDGHVRGYPQFTLTREGDRRDPYWLVVQDRGFVLMKANPQAD